MREHLWLKVMVAGLVIAVGYGAWRGLLIVRWIYDQNATTESFASLDELLTNTVPDAENAALVYQQAFDALELSSEDEDALQGERDPDRYGVFVRDRAAVERVLTKNAQSLAFAERAAAMERCQFEPKIDENLTVTWPQWQHMRRLGRMLSARAWLRGESGDIPGALADVEICLRMAGHVMAPPGNPIACLVAAAQTTYATDALSDVLSSADVSADDVAGLRATIGAFDFQEAFMTGLEFERAEYVAFLDRFGDRPRSFMLDPPPEAFSSRNLPPGQKRPAVGIWSGWVSISRAHYLHRIELLIERVKLPYRMLPAHVREPDALPERKRDPIWLMLASGPPYFNTASMQAKRDGTQMQLTLATIALDLKAYKHERGVYPEALGDLPQASQPGYVEDVCSGEPLIYRLEGEGFVVYSLGRDLDDDGGISLREVSKERRERHDADLVWRCEK